MSAMDGYGHTELNVECPLLPFQRQSFGLENELMEILWQDGEAFLQSQSHRKPNEHVPWVDDNSFDYLELMSGIPPSHLPEPNKLADVEEDFRLAIFNPIQLPLPAAAVSDREQGFVTDSSVMTMDLSNGSSCPVGNEVNKSSRGKGSNAVLAEVGDNSCRKVSSQINDIGKEMTEPENASFRGSASEDNKSSKRKIRDVDESASPSEDCQMESSGGKNRSPQKSIRRSRVAEVHNLSERRRRDRINEKMRALQKLIPHSHKSDKASMLDDAIKYMKSLQSQLQWWMGNGMAQTRMLQQLYHSGIGMRPPALPSMQNLVYLSGLPLVGQAMNPMPPPFGHGFLLDPFSSQNQMPPERKSEPRGVHFVPYAQSLDAAGFSSHAAQANHVSAHPHTGNSQMNL